MPDRSDRLTKFIDVINQDELERRARTQAQIEADCKRDFDMAANETKQRCKRIVESRAARQREDMNRAIYDETAAMRKRLSQKREQITDEVFSQAEKSICEFTKTENYKAFIEASVKAFGELYPENDITIYVKPSDLVLSEIIKAAFGRDCTVCADDSIKLGGCKAVCEKLRLKADNTLDSRLSAQRESFRLTSGLSVAAD